jgi:hypothetical protein
MSDIAVHDSGAAQVFRPVTVALVILIGAIGFFGMLVLSAYASDIDRSGHTGSHAVSNGATGYSGLVRLAAATGRNPLIVRSQQQWRSDDLIVAAPERAAVDISDLTSAREGNHPTLFVLPKWDIVKDTERRGWVRVQGLLPVSEPEGVFAPDRTFKIKRHTKKVSSFAWPEDGLPDDIRFVPPAKLQVIVPEADPPEADDEDAERQAPLQPLLTDGSGGIVLGQVGNLFILSDPDLLNNAGLKNRQNAAAALDALDYLNSSSGRTIGFDVVLNGLGGSKSLLRLAFDPPFLAMTLALAAAALMLGLRALGRFGAPTRRQRALAFGKAALVDNSALLVRKAGKAHKLGGRYAAVVRDQAVRTFGVSSRLNPAEVDAYLDALGGEPRFTELALAAEAAHSDGQLLAASRALHSWKRERLGDN